MADRYITFAYFSCCHLIREKNHAEKDPDTDKYYSKTFKDSTGKCLLTREHESLM